MTKQELIESFFKNHQELIDFVNSLTNENFTFSYSGKWTAGQQLNHVYLTIIPFTKVLLSKEYIIQKFGIIDRPTWDYNTVIENYSKTSLKAPPQYLPDETLSEQKEKIIADMQTTVLRIQSLLNQYTEEELDSLVLPHPLLGHLTIREMFYLMSYHPLHHLKQTKQNLSIY